jgi:antitoxin component YwqK of YwqJK toxin-antitoxin module
MLLLCMNVILAAPPCPDGAELKEHTTSEAREQVCETKDGSRNGARRAWYATTGKLWFVGEYSNGKRTGAWKFWFSSGTVMATAGYRDDKADGPMTRFFDSGVKEMEGVCKGGVEDGKWTRFWPNGKVQVVVTFKEGKDLAPVQYFSRRGGAIDLARWLAEKMPGVAPGTERYAHAMNANRPEALYGECRN